MLLGCSCALGSLWVMPLNRTQLHDQQLVHPLEGNDTRCEVAMQPRMHVLRLACHAERPAAGALADAAGSGPAQPLLGAAEQRADGAPEGGSQPAGKAFCPLVGPLEAAGRLCFSASAPSVPALLCVPGECCRQATRQTSGLCTHVLLICPVKGLLRHHVGSTQQVMVTSLACLTLSAVAQSKSPCTEVYCCAVQQTASKAKACTLAELSERHVALHSQAQQLSKLWQRTYAYIGRLVRVCWLKVCLAAASAWYLQQPFSSRRPTHAVQRLTLAGQGLHCLGASSHSSRHRTTPAGMGRHCLARHHLWHHPGLCAWVILRTRAARAES